MSNNPRGPAMSALLVAASFATTASVITTACIAYILISFRRSGHLLALRIGQQSPALVLAMLQHSRRRPLPNTRAEALRARRPLRPVFAH
jgi:hypothetical protein